MLCQVTAKLWNGTENREVWFLLQTDHETISSLHEALIRDGVIYGHRIDSYRVAHGIRRENARYEFIIARDSVVTISEPQVELLPPALAADVA